MQRLIQLSLLAVLCATVANVAAYGADWPTFLHDSQRSGVTADALTFPLTQQWSYNAPCAPAPGWGAAVEPANVWKANIPFIQLVRYDDSYQVAVASNCVYFCASGECKVYCIDAIAGIIKWVAFTDAPARCAPTVANGKVYIGTDDGYAYCLNATDGSQIWKFNATKGIDKELAQTRAASLWSIRTGILVDGGSAYFGAGVHPASTDATTPAPGFGATATNGLGMYALNADTGVQVWANTTVASVTGYNFSPQGYLACTATKIVAPAARAMPATFTRATGAFEYQVVGDSFGRSQPNGGSYVTVNGNYCYNGGNAVTQYDLVGYVTNQWGSQVYLPAVWSWGKAQQVVVSGTMTYLATDVDVIGLPSANCVAAIGACGIGVKTGFDTNSSPDYSKCSWRTTGQNVPSALIMAGNALIAGGNGKVAAYDPTTGALLWSDATLNGNVRGLAVSNGRLYASTTTGKIYCYASGGGGGTAISPPASTSPYPSDSYGTFYSQTADTIVSSAALTSGSTGFGIILGGSSPTAQTGRLAYELAKRTNMTFYVLEPSAANVAAAKAALHNAGMWGTRVVVWQGTLSQSPLPFPPYMANLVVDEEAFFGAPLTTTAPEITRILRPCGGKAFLGQPAGGAALGSTFSPAWNGWNANLGSSMTPTPSGTWESISRGMLTGSTEWSNQWCDPGNTGGCTDQLIIPPFKILWYGDPGPALQNDRHNGGPAPLVAYGRFFIQGNGCVMAYDAYNGQFLWQRTISGANRVYYNRNAQPLTFASDTSIFVAVNNVCYCLDAATGATLYTFNIPNAGSKKWGWVCAVGNTLYGSRTTDSNNNTATSDEIFALNITTGATIWTYTGTSIANCAIAVGDGKVFLVDQCSMTAAQQQQAHDERVADIGNYVDNLGNAITPDYRMIIALNASTGSVVWSRPRDVCDTVLSVAGGGAINLMCKNNLLLICGSPAGEAEAQDPYTAGSEARRSIGAFNTADGSKVWDGGKNYVTRPIIAGTTIYAEPWGYDLSTGNNLKTKNGSTWQYYRGWSGSCGAFCGSSNLLFSAGKGISYCDIAGMVNPDTSSTQGSNNMHPFVKGQRTGCAINFIPACGVIVMPESGAYCNCDIAVQDSLVSYGTGTVPEPPPAILPTTFHVFYNNSAWDGNDPAANAKDDAAIATDKWPITWGHNATATAANYTTYAKGINGIMIDISNMPGTPVASDFEFRTGNSNPSSNTSWTLKSTLHPTITVRKGAGDQGNDRITLIFPDGAVQNTWLQIRVKANAATNGLGSDLYYIVGNAIGGVAGNGRVATPDLAVVIQDLHRTFANPAPITDQADINRDKKVDTADQILCRSNYTTIVNQLKMITVP